MNKLSRCAWLETFSGLVTCQEVPLRVGVVHLVCGARVERAHCVFFRRVFVCWFVLRVGVYAWYAAPLAQLVERQSHNLKVASSILAGSNPFMPIDVVSCILYLACCSWHLQANKLAHRSLFEIEVRMRVF